MASVERRGSKWLARWRDPNGQQKSRTFVRRTDADNYLKNVQAEILRGSYVDPALGREALAVFWERWRILAAARLRPSTLGLHDLFWRLYVEPIFAQREIASITRLDVQSFIGAMIKDGASPYKIENAIRVLRALLNAAEEDGLIVRSPMARLKLPRRPPVQPDYYTADEIDLIAGAVPERWRAFILVAAYGGPRFGELAGLRIDCVDFLRRTIRIDHAIVEAGGQLHAGPTKNRQVRTVTLPAFVMEALADHVRRWPPDSDRLVFSDDRAGPVRRSNFYKRVWWPASKTVGVRRLKFHALRHTSAALAIAAGAHPKAIQERLGHHSAAFTLDTYGGLFEGIDRDVADRLDEMRPHSHPKEPRGQDGGRNGNVIPLRRRDSP